MPKASEQLMEYAVRKAEYHIELAESHIKSREPKKAKQLLLSAAAWFEKGGLIEKANEVRKRAAEL
ncbi:MAG: hypothetical protein ACTSRG_10125 [Candidatus Helarchaeota archaeon]